MPGFPGTDFVAGVVGRVRSLLRGLLHRSDLEAEMVQEFRHHIELRTEDLMRRGLAAAEASRRAHLEFGHVETHREAARASRGLRLFDQIRFSWIDLKLGIRMLVKHPGLTLVAIFALAVGIPVGMAPVHLSAALEAPLPEDPGNRVRAIRHWDPASGTAKSPTYRDFRVLREELTTFATLGAFRISSSNIASEGGRAAPVAGAEVTASSFDVLGTQPLLGLPDLCGDSRARHRRRRRGACRDRLDPGAGADGRRGQRAGMKVQQSIKKAEAGRAGIRFGGLTGVLIVADVALAVSVAGLALALGGLLWRVAGTDELTGIQADEYLAAEVRLSESDLGAGAGALSSQAAVQRRGATQRLLVERLEAEPGVRGVAVASALPRMDHGSRLLEVAGVEGPASLGGWQVRTAFVDVDFFTALSQPILAGRDFDRADLESEIAPIVVNTVFVDRLLGGRVPLGSRARFLSPDGGEDAPWHEIVGVVGNLGMSIVDPQGDPGVYVLAPPGAIRPIQLAIHLRDEPEDFAPRLREILAEVDPAAVLGTPVVLDRVYPGDWYLMTVIVGGLGLLVAILIALGASGLYAILSFSVSERRREIGIRTALGASRAAVVLTVLRRSLVQIVAGALLGMPIAAWLLLAFGEAAGRGTSPTLPLLAALGFTLGIVAVIGTASCFAPVRRALQVDPGSALRAEG